MPDKWTTQRSDLATTLGTSAIEHTPADTDLPINVKAVLFAGDGTISYKNATGAVITGFPVANGQLLPFVPARITAMTGATKCFLIQ
mgnify:CR=1 FL=1